jgi:RNA polymerase sigma-70 factor (ECF subfamily)
MVHPADTTREDAQLLRRMARQDREAFAQFYDRYADVLYSIDIRILHDPTEAADVLQEVFLQIWDKSHTFNAPDKPLVWAVAFARDQAVVLRTRHGVAWRSARGAPRSRGGQQCGGDPN